MTDVDMIAAYAAELAELALLARAELDAQLDNLGAAREAVDAAMARLHTACSLAERFAIFVARARDGVADPNDVATAAHAIAQLLVCPRSEAA